MVISGRSLEKNNVVPKNWGSTAGRRSGWLLIVGLLLNMFCNLFKVFTGVSGEILTGPNLIFKIG